MKLVSLLLSGALLLAGLGGCGKNAGAEGGKTGENGTTEILSEEEATGGRGRFLESELPLPENVKKLYASTLLENGSIALFLWNDKENIYQIQESEDNGESWRARDIDLEKAEEIFVNYVLTAAIKPDGTAAILFEQSRNELCLGIILPDGTVEKRELALPDVESQNQDYAFNIIGSEFDASGNLVIENLNSHFYKVDLTTGNCELLSDLEEKYARYFGVAGNQILAVASEGISIFGSTDGKVLEEDSVLNEMIAADTSLSETVSEFGRPLVFTGGNSEDIIFYANHQGLFCHTRGSSISEQLINGSLNSMGDTAVSFLDLMMVDEEHFLLTVAEASGGVKMLQYSYDKDAPSMPETELKVYALEDSTFLRQAISVYQKENQDVYVNLQIGMSGDDGMTAEDAIRALNTDILAGSGPDVLILDGLPVEKYIEKGILADISGVIEEIADNDGVFENVREVYEKEGAIYQFPARFYVNLVNGDEEAVAAGASLKKLADYVTEKKAAGESKIFPLRSAKHLLEKLYLADSAVWLEESGKLKEDAVKEYLTYAKQIYEAEPKENADVYYSYSGTLTNLLGTLEATGAAMKESKLDYGTVTSTSELIMAFSVKQQYGMDYELADRDTVKSFVPYQLAGIVKETARHDEAEDFLRTLFGAECGADSFNGFTVNKAAYETVFEKAKNLYDDYNVGGIVVSTDEGDRFEMNFQNLTEEELAKITGILESAEKPALMDQVIQEIVLEQGEKALKGDMTVDEAAAEIIKKCNLYLSE